MRELKFRVYDKDIAKYLEGCEIDSLMADLCSEGEGRTVIIKQICPARYIFEQYTGLKDKNGKDIYEGDVIKVNDDFDEYGINAGEIYAVYFKAGGFRCKPKYGLFITRGDKGFWIDDGNDYEVIGNIHENPDLLEGKWQ